MPPEDKLPLNPRDFIVLLVLAREASHGYGIMKSAEQFDGPRVALDPANLYRVLRRLERDGLVAADENQSGSDGREETTKRRVYSLTTLGRRVLQAETSRLARLTDAARAWKLIPELGAGP